METGGGATVQAQPVAMLFLVPASALLITGVAVATSGMVALHVMAPPAAALLAGFAMAWPTLREVARTPEAFGKSMVVLAMQETSVLFAFVIAFMFASPEAPPLASLWPFWLVGGAGAVTIAIQAGLLRARLRSAIPNAAYGRFLLLHVLAEVPVFAAFVVAFAGGMR